MDDSVETPTIKKSSTVLMDRYYDNPKTSLLIFHFEPHPFTTSLSRMKEASLRHLSLEGKEIYLIDDFFLKNEGDAVRDFCKKATFSRNSYGSQESIEKGEKPAKSMNNKERWQFFSNPPEPIREIFKLLGMFSFQMDADITTLPWDLCHDMTNSSSIVVNFLEEASYESMELGKHQDCHPEKGVSFGIPILYAQEKEYHPPQFVNGDPGKPWLVTLMLYTTAEKFLPEYRLGTVFCKSDKENVFKAGCKDMRMVLFESDIFHSIEESKIPRDTQSWRVSFVFKLIFNPRRNDQNLKREFKMRFGGQFIEASRF